MPDERGPKPPLHRNVWVASVTSFLTDVSSEMILNVLPLFLANVLGVRVWAVGAVEGLADTTAAITKLYSGWLSDRMRARKWLAVLGYSISAVSKPFYLLAGSWTAVAAIRWGDRVGKGVRTAPRDALLADSSPPSRRGLVFGLHRAADTGGAVVGLLVTLWVVGRMQGDGLDLQADTFHRLVLWSLIPAAVAVVVLAIGARDVSPGASSVVASDIEPDVASDDSTGPSVGRASRPAAAERGARERLGRGFFWFVVASVVFELGNSADAFLVLRAQERGLSVAGVLWVLLAFNVVYAAVAAPAGALSDRFGRRGIVLGGWVLYCLTYVGFALAQSAGHVVALYLLYGIHQGVVSGAAKALVADLVPVADRGLAYGTYAAGVGVVSLPASLIGGLLWEGFGAWNGFGPAAPFAFGATMAALAAVLLVVAVPARSRPPA